MRNPSGQTVSEIQLLGPVQIPGGPAGDRARTLHAACAWLSLHPNAAGCQIDRALQISAESRMSLLSRIRAWLGGQVLPTGKSTGRYTLRLQSDWDAVRQLVCTPAGSLRSESSQVALRAVLEKVSGEPLADVDAPWADGVRIQMSLLLEDVATVYARAAARSGCRREALWAIGRGLVARPESDVLRSAVAALVPATAGAARGQLLVGQRKVCVGRRPRTIHHTSRLA